MRSLGETDRSYTGSLGSWAGSWERGLAAWSPALPRGAFERGNVVMLERGFLLSLPSVENLVAGCRDIEANQRWALAGFKGRRLTASLLGVGIDKRPFMVCGAWWDWCWPPPCFQP